MSKRQNYTSQHAPKKKKEFGLAYLDTTGQYNRLYEATFKGPNDDFLVNMSPDDPRLKLQKQREDEEWERFKKRNMKIKVNYFKSEEERRRYLESKEPLPINPHMIVLSKDPKRKIVTQRKREEILISDVPRDGNIYFKDEMSDYFNKQFDEGLVQEKDYINLRLINEINLRHPRKFDDLGKPEKYSLITDGFGYFGCSDESMFCDMNKFGIGLVDYFRILKINILFYLFLAFISFLCLYSCGENFSKINDIEHIFHFSSIKDFLTKFSLGNVISKDYYKCQMEDTSDNQNIKEIALHCDYYDKDNYFYMNKNSILFFETSKETDVTYGDTICNNYIINKKYESPFKKSDRISIRSIKKYTKCNERHSVCVINISEFKKKIEASTFIEYKCFYSSKYFYNNNDSLLTFFNIFIIIICALYYILLVKIIKISTKVHNDNLYQINQYTVHVKNVNINPKPPKLYQDLNLLIITLHNAAQYYKIELSDLEINDEFNDEPIYKSSGAIYQISYSLFDNTYLDLVKKKFDLLSTIEKPNYTKKKQTILDSKLTNRLFDVNLRRSEKVEIREQIQSYNNQLNIEKYVCDNVKINDVFVTFKTKGHAEKCFNCYNSKSKYFRFFIEKCLRQKRDLIPFYYKDQWLDVDYIPSPADGIKYENLRFDDITPKLPKPMSVLIVVILLGGNLFVYFIQKYFQRQFDSEYINDINCSLFISKEKLGSFISINEVMADEEKEILDRYDTYCYCKYNLDEFGKDIARNVYYERSLISLNDGKEAQKVRVFPCRKWLESLDSFQKMDFVMYALMIVYNSFALWIIQLLPKYERYKTKMEERKRLMILTYFFSIFANGINAHIANAHISDFLSENVWFIPFFTGKYLNFNGYWFYNVGSTITFMILLNSIIPYFLDYLKFFSMLFIRRFCCKGILNKNNKSYFLYWYEGPEYHLEVKLGVHLSLISIILFFNFATTNFFSLIILIVTTFISFILDKILFLRYCKIPEDYNEDLNKLYCKIFLIVIIVSTLLNCYQNSFFTHILNDIAPFTDQLGSLLGNGIFWLYLFIMIILILYNFLRYSVIPFLYFYFKAEKNVAYGFADNKAFEKDFAKDFTIYESLPLSVLYKNYKIRELEYSQIQKYSLYHDVDKLLEFYRQKLDIDRQAIQKKVTILMKDRIDLDENFDYKIKLLMQKYEKDIDDTKIKKDFSYNMSYYDIFEACYIEKMIEN